MSTEPSIFRLWPVMRATALVGVATATVFVLTVVIFFLGLIVQDRALGTDSMGSLLGSTKYADYTVTRARDDALLLEQVVDAVRRIAPSARHERRDGVDHIVLSGDEDSVEVRMILRNEGYEFRHVDYGQDFGLAEASIAGSPIKFGTLFVAQLIAMTGVGWLGFRRIARGPAGPFPAAVGVGLLVGGGALVVGLLMETVLGWLGAPVTEQAWVEPTLRSGGISTLAFVLLIAVGAPVAEEIFFRGYVFRFLGEQVNVPFAYVASAGVFAGIHLNPSGLPIYFVYGVLLAFALRRGRSLISAIVAHAMVNASSVALFFANG